MIVAIPTKGRAGKVKTLKYFPNAILFVEPEEYETYSFEYNKNRVVYIGQNNGGISYVRNFILDYFDEPVLMLDDDITKLFYRKGNKLYIIGDTRELIKSIDSCFKKGYKQVTLSYKASNWLCSEPYKVNTRCWCFNGIDCRLPIRYDSKSDVFEDYDFTAQLIHGGYKNICLYVYAFECEKMGSNSGGWQMFDRQEKSKLAKEYLIKKWGKHVVKTRFNEFTNISEVQFLWSKI